MSDLATFTKHDNVGVVTLNNPPVNALSHELRLALRDAFKAAIADPNVEAIVLRCEGRTFVAGADIREFDRPPASPDVNEIVEWVGQCPKPVTALLHGTALGGGVELALACQFRVAAPDAQLGFPEVNLGILPGAGGTQRLPRLIGVRPALELIVGGSPTTAPKALELGLIDHIVSSDLLAGALEFTRRMLREAPSHPKLVERKPTLDDPAIWSEYEALVARTHRGFLAPTRCIQAIRAAVELPFHEGLKRERELFLELLHSPESKAQRHAFFGEREVARSPRLARDVRAREVRSVAVVGDGESAVHMARRFADRRIPVMLFTPSGHTPEQPVEGANLRVASAYDDLKDADVVVVTLSGSALTEVLPHLDAACSSDAIVAITSMDTNVRELAQVTARPERLLGLNIEGPTLLEVIAPASTSAVACATAMGLAKPLRRVAVLEQAERGSASDRLRQVCRDVVRVLLQQGKSAATMDNALSELGRITREASLSPEPTAASPASTDAEMALVRRAVVSAMANEGARLLEESVLSRALEVDMIAIHGHGFPVYLGGPLFHAHQVGLDVVHAQLLALEPPEARLQPTALLAKLSEEGGALDP